MSTIMNSLPDPLPEFFDCGCSDIYYCPQSRRSNAPGAVASMSAATHLISTSCSMRDRRFGRSPARDTLRPRAVAPPGWDEAGGKISQGETRGFFSSSFQRGGPWWRSPQWFVGAPPEGLRPT